MNEIILEQLNCILLVDDYDFTNIFNRRVLEKAEVAKHIYAVKDGHSALRFLKKEGEFENTEEEIPTPDLIFLDINMPVMDGWEFLNEFSNLKEHFKDVVVIILTTSPNPDDEEKAKEIMDVDGYYIKPISKLMLTEILSKHF